MVAPIIDKPMKQTRRRRKPSYTPVEYDIRIQVDHFAPMAQVVTINFDVPYDSEFGQAVLKRAWEPFSADVWLIVPRIATRGCWFRVIQITRMANDWDSWREPMLGVEAVTTLWSKGEDFTPPPRTANAVLTRWFPQLASG